MVHDVHLLTGKSNLDCLKTTYVEKCFLCFGNNANHDDGRTPSTFLFRSTLSCYLLVTRAGMCTVKHTESIHRSHFTEGIGSIRPETEKEKIDESVQRRSVR